MTQTAEEIRPDGYQMQLDRTVIAFRKAYMHLVSSGAMTTVWRPGNRVAPATRGYWPGEVVTARVIDVPGQDRYDIEPVFNGVERAVRVQSAEEFDIQKLTAAQFVGSSPDIFDVTSLQYHLALLYNKPADAFESGTVTRITLDYI